MEQMTVLEFTDTELNVLNQIVRQHKVEVTNEDLVLLMMGKRTTPLVDLTVKVGTAFEKRAAEIAANPPVVEPVAETVVEA